MNRQMENATTYRVIPTKSGWSIASDTPDPETYNKQSRYDHLRSVLDSVIQNLDKWHAEQKEIDAKYGLMKFIMGQVSANLDKWASKWELTNGTNRKKDEKVKA